MSTGVLIRLVVSQVLMYASMVGARMAAPLLVLRDGEGAIFSGVVVASFALAPALLSLAAGQLVERHGLHRPMVICTGLALGGLAVAIALPTFWVLCVTGLLVGAATNAATIAVTRHAGRASSDTVTLKKAFAWMSIGPAAANFIGPFFAGLVIDHAGATPGDNTGYRMAFVMLAGFSLIAWLALRGLPELAPAARAAAQRGKVLDLLREPGMVKLLFINWCLAVSWDVHNVIVPVLGHERGYSASVIGAIMGAMAIAATGARLLMPWIAARLSEHITLAAALACASLAFFIYPFTTSPPWMALASMVLGFTVGAVQPVVVTALYQITPEGRQSEALGLRLASLNTSNMITPILSGALTTVIGVAPVFWLACFVVALGVQPGWSMRARLAQVARR